MTPKEALLQKMEEMGISAKRSLGQNFLINPNTIQKIINSAANTKPESLIEIGPGLGALTEHLRQMAVPLQLIEMDREFSKYWTSQGLPVNEVDALKFAWDTIAGENITLVSNLPYQISARLVIELSAGPNAIQNMVLMFQKEVAERIVAQPKTKDYGFLSVVAQLAWNAKKVIDANAGDFFPPPKVTSRVLHFERKAGLGNELIGFVKKAFENRRKLMLKNFGERAPVLKNWLVQNSYSEKVRAEELKPQDFVRLFEVWQAAEHGQ